MRDNTGKKRISKKDSLEWLAGHCELLKKINVLEALNRHKDNKNVSIRKLTTCYGKKHPWLQKRLREDAKPKLTQSQIEDLLNKIEFLAKKKN